MRNRWVWMPLILAGFVAIAVACGALVMVLWNWLAPSLFHLPSITFWQALGLLVLCRILFGSIGSGSRDSGGGGDRRRSGNGPGPMTDEERQRLRSGPSSPTEA